MTCFDFSGPGGPGGPFKPKGSICAEAKNIFPRAPVRKPGPVRIRVYIEMKSSKKSNKINFLSYNMM